MPEVDLYNMEGEKAGTLVVSEAVFEAPPNEAVLHQAVTAQLAAQRQGTHKVKARGEVRGGGRKPWRQKGTGRARHGSRRAPDFRGGGVVHGPAPRSYRQRLPRKMRREALRSALAVRYQSDGLRVLEEFRIETPRTRVAAQLVSALAQDGGALLVLTGLDEPTRLSVRNLAEVRPVLADQLSALDVMRCARLIMTKEAVTAVEGRLS